MVSSSRGGRPRDERLRGEVGGGTVEVVVAETLAWLEGEGSVENREGMKRYGIVAAWSFGVSVAALRARARVLGRSHALAEGLWATGCYEARMLACFVDDPKAVTIEQMERWASRFESWADCDTACFHLFDKTPHAVEVAKSWSGREAELVKRAGFALMASLALHDKRADDSVFEGFLPAIEREAGDGRNLVKKGVSWALRGIGRRGVGLHGRALAVAERLAASEEAPRRWVGKDALRDLRSKAPRGLDQRKASKRKART